MDIGDSHPRIHLEGGWLGQREHAPTTLLPVVKVVSPTPLLSTNQFSLPHLFYILYTFVGHIGCRYFFLTYGLYFLFVYVTFYKKPSESFNINVIKLLVFFITVHPLVVLCLRNPIQL